MPGASSTLPPFSHLRTVCFHEPTRQTAPVARRASDTASSCSTVRRREQWTDEERRREYEWRAAAERIAGGRRAKRGRVTEHAWPSHRCGVLVLEEELWATAAANCWESQPSSVLALTAAHAAATVVQTRNATTRRASCGCDSKCTANGDDAAAAGTSGEASRKPFSRCAVQPASCTKLEQCT